MNPCVAGIKKDLVPRYIVNGICTYLGFAHETTMQPRKFFDFLECGDFVEDHTVRIDGDMVYKLSLMAYFELNDKIMSNGFKYNLMKKRHEYNTRKYGKICSKSNTV